MSKKESNNNGLKIVNYSEKSFAVIGETKPFKDQMKELGGAWNRGLTCGAGWIFSNKARERVEKFLKTGKVPAKKTSK